MDDPHIGGVMRLRQTWAQAKGEKVLAEEFRRAADRIVALEAQLDATFLYQKNRDLRERVVALEAERDRLAAQLARLVRETRPTHVRTAEPPDGWVWLHNQWDEIDESMHELWASSKAYSHDRESVWIPTRSVTEERFVTPWRAAGSTDSSTP